MRDYLLGKPWLVPAVAFLSVCVAVVFGAFNDGETVLTVLQEGGPIENYSAILDFVAAAIAFWFWRRGAGLFALIGTCAFLMAGRELDWHHALTSHGIFSTKLYFYASVPVHEKILGAVLVIGMIAALIWLFLRSLTDLKRLWDLKAPAGFGILAMLFIAPTIKFIDAEPRLATEAGAPLTALVTRILLSVEEIGESTLPFLVVIVVLQAIRDLPERPRHPVGA